MRSPVRDLPRPILCWRTTRAIAFSEAWPIDNAQNQLQVLCGRRSLPTPHVFDDSSAAKGAASVSRLVLDTSVHFLRFKDFFAVAKGNMYTLADRVRVVTLKGEYVGQEGILRAHRSWASPFAPVPK